jgi:hypothetical protein
MDKKVWINPEIKILSVKELTLSGPTFQPAEGVSHSQWAPGVGQNSPVTYNTMSGS